MNVSVHDDMVRWAYDNQCREDRIASLAAYLDEAAERGIEKAKDFLRLGATILAERAKVMMRRANVRTVVPREASSSRGLTTGLSRKR